MSFVDKKDLSESHKKSLRPKVQMGGSVFKNGKNVDKEIEAQTAKKRSTSDGYMPKQSAQDKEDAATNKMAKRLKTKSEGVRNTKKILG